MLERLTNRNIKKIEPLDITPNELKEVFPITDYAMTSVIQNRREIEEILDKKDDRIIIITGPCSLHDKKSALDYASRLHELSNEVDDKFLLVMRGYLEKPRTILGWKGIINDHNLDGQRDVKKGLIAARDILTDINELGVPISTEFVGTWTPQYVDDLISLVAIGARTSESQPHRELASGLSMPVGFKNNTYGDMQVAVDGAKAARGSHVFLGIDGDGLGSYVETSGNEYSHIILRGGNGKPNCDPEFVNSAMNMLERAMLPKNIIVDCSHGNSNKKYIEQPNVFYKVIDQIINGNESIVGLMLESHINEGKQPFPNTKEERNNLKYGVSITDGCISWNATEQLIRKAYEMFNGLK
tara:strand:- start:398 stop:1465 length:1068 start_codon:yes stop_codon:yes gene_type:complete